VWQQLPILIFLKNDFVMTGIQIKYAELFSLSIQQLFYENKVCKKYTTTPEPDILLVPTDKCLSILKSLDLVYRNTSRNGGCIVLARVSQKNTAGNDVLRFKPDSSESLGFLMVTRNPDIVNFNDLPVQPATDRVYYFNNSIADAGALRNDLHLSLSAAGVDGLNDSIKLSNANYRFHHTAVVAAGTAKLIRVASGDSLMPVSVVNQGGQSDLTFNLSAMTAGKCRLIINNIVVDEFFYPGSTTGGSLFGVVEISLSAALAANYRVVEADGSLTPDRPLYIIELINRQTFWRYRVHLQPNSPLYLEMASLNAADKTDFLNRLNILSNDTGITFTKTSFSDAGFEFLSDNAVALHEKYFSVTDPAHPPLNLTLKKYIGNAPKEAAVKSNLPYPPPGNLDTSVPPKIYSDIFLTI
jgi:hypothetical protein